MDSDAGLHLDDAGGDLHEFEPQAVELSAAPDRQHSGHVEPTLHLPQRQQPRFRRPPATVETGDHHISTRLTNLSGIVGRRQTFPHESVHLTGRTVHDAHAFA